MRKLAIVVPVAMVAGFVIHEAVQHDTSRVKVADAAALTVVELPAVPEVPVLPTVPVEPEVAAVGEADLAELAALRARLAEVAVAIPAIEIDVQELANLRVHAEAEADIAAAVNGFVELLEQKKYSAMNEEQIVEITGSLLADIATNLEAFLTIETREGKVRVVRDTGGGE